MSIFTPVLGKPLPEPVPGVRQIFTDGGVAGKNPSPIGGTWAWCEVENSKIVMSDSGKLVAGEFGNSDLITNNATELNGVLQALSFAYCSTPKSPVRIQIHTDSVCAAKWALGKGSMENVPPYLVARLEIVRALIADGKIEVGLSLMGGHPNPDDLKRGYRVQNGKSALPVSKWNVWCDEECTRLAAEMQGKSKRKPGPHGAKQSKNGVRFLPNEPAKAVLPPGIIEIGPFFDYAPPVPIPALASASVKAVQLDMFGEGAA